MSNPYYTLPEPAPKKPMSGGVKLALGVVLAALLMGAGSLMGRPTTAPVTAAVTAPAVPATTAAAAPVEDATVESESPDDRFDALIPILSKETPTAAEMASLRTLGHTTCSSIDKGVTKDNMIAVMLGQDISPTSRTGMLVMAAMVAATGTYCSEHEGFFSA